MKLALNLHPTTVAYLFMNNERLDEYNELVETLRDEDLILDYITIEKGNVQIAISNVVSELKDHLSFKSVFNYQFDKDGEVSLTLDCMNYCEGYSDLMAGFWLNDINDIVMSDSSEQEKATNLSPEILAVLKAYRVTVPVVKSLIVEIAPKLSENVQISFGLNIEGDDQTVYYQNSQEIMDKRFSSLVEKLEKRLETLKQEGLQENISEIRLITSLRNNLRIGAFVCFDHADGSLLASASIGTCDLNSTNNHHDFDVALSLSNHSGSLRYGTKIYNVKAISPDEIQLFDTKFYINNEFCSQRQFEEILSTVEPLLTKLTFGPFVENLNFTEFEYLPTNGTNHEFRTSLMLKK